MANDETQTPRVERGGTTKLIAPYDGGELVSVHPPKGPGTYQNVGREILGDGLGLQRGSETAFLSSAAYNSKEPEFREVINMLRVGWLHVYQVNFWLPNNEGMYSVHDPNALGKSMKFNRDELEARLDGAEVYEGVRFNPETGVAFAPGKTIRFGKEYNWDKFARNGMNIAIFSPEGAEVLAKELGKNHFNYGRNRGISGNEEVEISLSALGDFRYFDLRLFVDGSIWDGGGRAFRVLNFDKK